MKGFYELFKNSGAEFKHVRTLTTTGMLIAVGIILRFIAIQLTPDIRISFVFLPVVIVAMLYGPVVSGMSAVAIDFLGYVLSDAKIREYSILLSVIEIFAGIIYGLILYNKKTNLVKIFISRLTVVIICNMILKTLIIYVLYVNKNFDITSVSQLHSLGVWSVPRLIENSVQLPFDMILMSVVIPVAIKAYTKVTGDFAKVN